MKIIFATHNQNKLEEIKELLKNTNHQIISLKDLKDEDEVNESGLTFSENAQIKAEYYFKKYKIPTLADDSGLVVPSLNGEPGIFSARYSGGTDLDNNKLLLLKMEEVVDRRAYYFCSLCFFDGHAYFFEGDCHGVIGHLEKGTNGFGYDPLFIYGKKTFAEIPLAEKNKLSHRYKALKKWCEFISKK